jgi:spermidine synthase
MSQMIELFDDYEKLFEDYEASFDNLGDPSPLICEYRNAVCLQFDGNHVQSAMYKHAPDELLLSYTRTMMKFLAFNIQPRHVGIIGLGGGSIPKYCYRRLPDTAISVAEISPEVIALRDRFLIPKDDDRFRIYCEDGAHFVRRQSGHFDVLLVDGFDDNGQPPQLCSREFYSHCYRSLTSPGLLVVNVCDGPHLISRIRRCFRNQVLVADGGDSSSNTIVFAGKGNMLCDSKWSQKAEGSAQQLPIAQWAMIA